MKRDGAPRERDSRRRDTNVDARPPGGVRSSRASGKVEAGRRTSHDAILTSLQIETPLEEFRRHFQKRKRSFEGTAGGRSTDVYQRAFDLAEQLIRKQRGGDERC